jgi:hypothetical protein
MKKNIIIISFFFTSIVYSQNFWQQTNGPFGGIVNTIAVSPSGDLFAGTDGGIYLSRDNGNS